MKPNLSYASTESSERDAIELFHVSYISNTLKWIFILSYLFYVLGLLKNIFKKITGKDYNLIKSVIEKYWNVFDIIISQFKRIKQKSYQNQLIDDKFYRVVYLNNVTNLEPIETTRNGNCLYNAISIIIFGCEDYFYLIKICVLSILLRYEAYFRNILLKCDSQFSFEEYIENCAIQFSWGDEISQIAVSILLDRPLYVYSFDPIKLIPYSYEFCVNPNSLNKFSINLGFIVNHFVALLPKDINVKPLKPRINPFINQFQLITQK